jgi:hypothetical protein
MLFWVRWTVIGLVVGYLLIKKKIFWKVYRNSVVTKV